MSDHFPTPLGEWVRRGVAYIDEPEPDGRTAWSVLVTFYSKDAAEEFYRRVDTAITEACDA